MALGFRVLRFKTEGFGMSTVVVFQGRGSRVSLGWFHNNFE